jgi:CRISPR/Cas system-associated protein Cas10 (large subunit of type III CRISPR-Cas system)
MTYRNKKLLEYARRLPCQHCGADDGKGRGLKASDYRIASLCYTCHSEIDQGKKLDKSERVQMFEDAHRSTIGEFFERGYIVPK